MHCHRRSPRGRVCHRGRQPFLNSFADQREAILSCHGELAEEGGPPSWRTKVAPWFPTRRTPELARPIWRASTSHLDGHLHGRGEVPEEKRTKVRLGDISWPNTASDAHSHSGQRAQMHARVGDKLSCAGDISAGFCIVLEAASGVFKSQGWKQ